MYPPVIKRYNGHSYIIYIYINDKLNWNISIQGGFFSIDFQSGK